MEAVGAGAGVLAFITIALRSTKSIYEIASVIRNGPAEIEHLASAVSRLQSLLTQLSKLPALELADSALDLERFSLFSSLVKTCENDVSRFEQELKRVQIKPKDKKAGIAWKKIKTILKEAECRRMREVVNNHVTELGVQLSMIQSNTGSFCKDKLIHLTEAMSERAENDRIQMDLLQQTSADLSIINHSVKNLNHTSISIEGQLRDNLAPLAQKIDQIPGMSAMQSENICVLLKALQNQVSELSTQVQHPEHIPYRESRNSDVSEQENDNLEPEKHHELLQSIERLCQLAKQKGGTVSDEEAEVIADDLNALLESASVQLSQRKSKLHASKKRSIDLIEKESTADCRELKRMRSLLSSSDSIVVNQGVHPSSISRNAKISGKCSRKEIQTAYGKIIMTTKRRQWCAASSSPQKGITHQKNTTEFTGTITAMLDQFQANLTVNFHQRATGSGYLTLYPSISVGMTLPGDSPIFRLVRNGDMAGLRSLLSQGKASLRDRSSYGKPLLHYAIEQPEVCKFLIENGADVDEIVKIFDFGQGYSTAISRQWGLHDISEERHFNIIECRRLLLNAGADPTLSGGIDMQNSALRASLVHDDFLDLKILLDLGESFIDLEERDENGDSSLLTLARNYGRHSDPEKFALLLRKGSNIHARNSYTGDSCLHIILSSIDFPRFRERDCLTILIKKGADINACNYGGVSVFEVAYSSLNDGYLGRPVVGYQGDLWDAALSECGYDIAQMRKGFPRRPEYEIRYTRQDFENMWRGRERFCPYYYDPPVWDPEGVEHQQSFDERVVLDE